MALGYTKRTWVNGGAPALSATNLQAVDDGVKAVSDWADTLLASTGIPNAAQAPKALGADLVALITAAGYTLNPATGTASLDGIADGTTYKRILAAVATALNAGTYDAASVSAFGIGVATPAVLTTEAGIDAIAGGGIYKFYSDTVGPFPGAGVSILAIAYSAGAFTYIAAQNGGGIKYRYTGDATWKTFWTSYSDGNGGQPPEAKSRDTTDGNIGQSRRIATADGAALTLPANGTWIVLYAGSVTTSTGAIKYNGWHNSDTTNILAGGSTVNSAAPDTIHYAVIKRLSA